MSKSDKKDYATMMRVMGAEATYASTLNKLNDIAIDTEDDKLKVAATALASRIRSFAGQKPAGKGRLLTLAANFTAPNANADLSRKQFGEGIQNIWKYCEAMAAKEQPLWQILALRAGWKPPAEEQQP